MIPPFESEFTLFTYGTNCESILMSMCQYFKTCRDCRFPMAPHAPFRALIPYQSVGLGSDDRRNALSSRGTSGKNLTLRSLRSCEPLQMLRRRRADGRKLHCPGVQNRLGPSADVIYDGGPEGGFNMNTVMHFQRIDQLCNRGDAKYGFYHSKHTAEDK